jgi:hypothetical protein
VNICLIRWEGDELSDQSELCRLKAVVLRRELVSRPVPVLELSPLEIGTLLGRSAERPTEGYFGEMEAVQDTSQFNNDGFPTENLSNNRSAPY